MPPTQSDRRSTLDALRLQLARIAPAPGPRLDRLSTGHAALDAATGGWPRPGLTWIQGAPGSGRFHLVLPTIQALTLQGRTVAIVDVLGWLNPPGLPGIDLDHLLLVRPGPSRSAWAAEQLARCSGVALLLILDPPRAGRSGRRLQHAAEAGHTAIISMSEQAPGQTPVRLELTIESDLGRQPDRPVHEGWAGSGADRAHLSVQIIRGGRVPPGRSVQLGRRSTQSPNTAAMSR